MSYNQKYVEIANHIRDEIIEGFYKPNEYLPGENLLAENHNVSRTTIRNSLRILVEEKFIKTEQGKGNKVLFSKIRSEHPKIFSFTEVLKKAGKESILSEISVEKINPTRRIGEKLNILINIDKNLVETQVIKYKRVREVEGYPISLHISYIQSSYLNDYSIEKFAKQQSFYKVLRENYNISFSSVEDEIEAVLANDYLAEKLKIGKGNPILKISRNAFDINGRIIEFSENYYVGERYAHVVSFSEER